MARFEAEYNTKAQADTFVRVFNLVNGSGRHAWATNPAPGVYRVFIHTP